MKMHVIALLMMSAGFTSAAFTSGCLKPKISDSVIMPDLGWYEPKYDVNLRITVSCKKGYYLYDLYEGEYVDGNSVDAECLFGNTYSIKLEMECRKTVPKTCKLPVQPGLKVTPLKRNYTAGDSLSCTCEDGYGLFGVETIYCSSNGKFSPPVPTCLPNCPRPDQSQLTINPDKNIYEAWETVTLECDTGYKLFGDRKRRCEDGQIFPAVTTETCRKMGCDPPSRFKNGEYTPQKQKYDEGDVIRYSCKESYYIDGKAERVCDTSGEFIYGEPTCVEISCNQPLGIENGLFVPASKKKYAVGEYVTYRCNKNFKLSTPSGRRTCRLTRDRTSAEFEEKPTCIRITCSRPMDIGNGSFSPVQRSYFPRDDVTYSCDEGYKLSQTSGRSVCKLDEGGQTASFTGVPECIRVTCSRPMDIDHGSFSPAQRTYAIDDEVTYSCDDGYRLSRPNAQSVCRLEKGNKASFTDPPRCTRITCSRPTAIDNASFTPVQRTYVLGDDVTYSCDEGYELSRPSGRSLCRLDKEGQTASFTEPPKCTRVTCSTPMNIDNGSFSPVQKIYVLGDDITYSCDEGYKLSRPNGRSVCRFERGRRKASFTDPPECIRITCGRPMNTENGSFRPVQRTYPPGDQVTYSCDEGYKLSQPSGRSVCRLDEGGETASFDDAPECKSITCNRPMDIDDGSFGPMQRTYLVGEDVTYSCNDGYRLSQPSGRLVCKLDKGRETASFNDQPECIRVTCSRPMDIDNASFSPEQKIYVLGDDVMYSCDDGYELSRPSGRSVCKLGRGGKTASFSDPPECLEIPCSKPMSIDNGSFRPVKKVYYVGDVVTYRCKRGYTLSRSPGTSVCFPDINGRDAAFEEAPKCLRASCDNPGSPENGYIKRDKPSYDVGEVVTFGCDDCYALLGESSSTCQTEGEFDSILPTCQPKECLWHPAVPIDGGVEPLKTNYECSETITYICNMGYRLVGNDTTTCLGDGEFSGKTPICEGITCPQPRLNKNVIVRPLRKVYPYKLTIKYMCRWGYTLQGSETATCELNGKFSNPSPRCIENKCGPPPIPSNGRLRKDYGRSEFRVGDMVEYECDQYYFISGMDYNECGTDGRWNQGLPACDPPSCQGSCFLPNLPGRVCQCDFQCVSRGDCCNDYTKSCQQFSCQGRCGEQVLGGCLCDSSCSVSGGFGCCTDYYTACPGIWYK